MKKEDIVNSLNNITPDENTVSKMREEIFAHSIKKRRERFIRRIGVKKAITAAVLVFVITAGALTYSLLPGTPTGSWIDVETGVGERMGDSFAHLIGGDLAPGSAEYYQDGRMPDIAPYYQFKIDNKYYTLMFETQKTEFNLPENIVDSDIGGKLATISGGDKTCVVYSYIPAGSEAVVAVKIDGEYQLYMFIGFESYINNQDEDAKEYLKLYGIKSASDIAKIQILGYSKNALPANGEYIFTRDIKVELTDKATVKEFYNNFAAMKNSSDKYFNLLYGYRDSTTTNSSGPTQTTPPDYRVDDGDMPMTIEPDMPFAEDGVVFDKDYPADGVSYSGNAGSVMPTEPADTGKALLDSVTIRIYNQSGIYMDFEYYTNIGFISRFELSDAFAAFLARFVG